MADKMYKVRVLVGDDKPGLIPYTYHLPASNRDEAVSLVRKAIRSRGNRIVKHVDFARLAKAPVSV